MFLLFVFMQGRRQSDPKPTEWPTSRGQGVVVRMALILQPNGTEPEKTED